MSAQLKAELKKASSLAQSGRFAEAVPLYRSVLASAPGDPEATHFLGVCLVQSGTPAEGLPLLERAIALAPHNAMYRLNYGLLLAESGDLAHAERQFRALAGQEPGNAPARNFLGMALQRQGRFDEAVAAYEEALRLAPLDSAAMNNLGYCLLERGAAEAAAQWLRRALAADPRNAMAHTNLGNVLRTQADLGAALESYRRALALAPSSAEAAYNLALTLRDLDDATALDAVRAAVRSAPQHAAAWQLFAELLAPLRFTSWDDALAADCERLYAQTQVEVQPCAEAVLSLVRAAPRGRLFVLLLEHALVADETFEAEMTALRRELLGAPISLELACALAQQCFLNGYLWPQSAEECALLQALPRETPLQVALAAMYGPLRGVQKPHGGSEAFDRMWRRLVEEPAAEAQLPITALTAVDDEISRKVQAQYEVHPYPRWHRAPAAGAFPLPRQLRALFPRAAPAQLAAPGAPDVLIAGCGTGRHAAITAQLQPFGRVLAVDLSRPSLAYAMRRARELGLANLEFAQADILRLGALERRFDLIECSGVLHHMADPLAGWKVLLGLLRPGGFMKVGLYSEAARRHIVAARERVAGLDVQAARAQIFALAAEDPARAVTALRDFYSAPGVRDLLLHVQEHRFTIPKLRQALSALGVEFLGFEFEGKAAAVELDEGEALERAQPDTFASMYQFWIRKER
jgi:tetratricopeptide (TPR) repeat protein/SAM-dependent methyltransferase